jgi:transposase
MSPRPVSSKAWASFCGRNKENPKTQKRKRNQTMNCLSCSEKMKRGAVLGLDVAKASVQAELRLPWSNGKVRFAFANEPSGFTKLEQVLAQHHCAKVHAGLEATGPYSQQLALWLYEQDHRVSLLNPRRVKDYARSAGARNKSDAIDAGLIADFVIAHRARCKEWQPPKAEVAQLQGLVRRREEVCVMLLAEKNRLEASSGQVRCSLQRLITALNEEKTCLDKLIAHQIRSHPELARNEQLLCTIKGIGSLTAAILLAEMVGPDQVRRARQAAAHAGLSPRREQSGTTVRRNKGIGKQGNRHLRKALYMPALVAIKYNEPLQHFARRLSAAGKPKMAVVCAVMRKLIHIAFGVLKHQQPFNPSLV